MLSMSVLLGSIYGQHEKKSVFAWDKDFPEDISDLLAIQCKIQSQLERLQDTIVSLEAESGAGSGVVVSADGLILTAAHVIGDSGRKMNVVFNNGDKVEAMTLGGSELSDAGMLKIIEAGERKFASVALADSSDIGDWCFALGHPSGFDLARGSVLRIGRIINKKDETIQTDCRLLGGDSGGPLFSMDGKLIGIHSRISQGPEDNFHTPIESFISNWEYFFNQELLTIDGMQEGGFLGILCEDSQNGLLVLEVVKNSAAEDAGITAGDILKRFDGIILDTREKLTILVSSKSPGSSVTIDYLRDEQEVTVRIELGERKQEE